MTAPDRYRKERQMVVAMTRRATRELADKIPPDTPEHLRKALIAQNVMRLCLETLLREMLPYDPLFLVELGNRLAAYTVTAGPPAMQRAMPRAPRRSCCALHQSGPVRSARSRAGAAMPRVAVALQAARPQRARARAG